MKRYHSENRVIANLILMREKIQRLALQIKSAADNLFKHDYTKQLF